MNKKQKIKKAAKPSGAKETNSAAYKKAVAEKGGHHDCFVCPPFKGDNRVARTPKRGAKKPRHKDKR